MNTKIPQFDHHDRRNTTYPAKEKICTILGISFQSTHDEVLYAYKEQLNTIESIKPKDQIEKSLLQEKQNVLLEAYGTYCEELDAKGVMNISSSIASVKQKTRNKSTMYSFHIPCIFWCMFKGVDCVWNCCCAGCSCCGDSYDCWSECYNEGGACDCLRPIDTFIAIIGMIAGVIWLISKIGPSISSAASNASADRSRRRADNERQKIIRNYQKDYLPKLTRAYEEWNELQQYNVDIRRFLGKLSTISINGQADAEYNQMQQEVDRSYSMLEKRWNNLQEYLDDLKSPKNSTFYSYLRSEAPGRERYLEMFSSNKLPWRN